MTDARNTVDVERRNSTELRATGRKLEGYAAVFGAVAPLGDFRERIQPGAFTRTLASGVDILALADHDPTRLLARTKAGTLKLAQDTRGLHFEIDLPDTQLGRDMAELARRGDLGGMSFAFRAMREAWPDRRTREIHEAGLVEVSVVHAFPAYAATSVNLRHRPAIPASPLSSAARRRWLDTL